MVMIVAKFLFKVHILGFSLLSDIYTVLSALMYAIKVDKVSNNEVLYKDV